VPTGWLKVAMAKPPGLQVRTASFGVTAIDAIVVMRANETAPIFLSSPAT
jgi:hypothetical protein